MNDIFSQNLYGTGEDQINVNEADKLPTLHKELAEVNFQLNQKTASEQILPSTFNSKKNALLSNSSNSVNKAEIYNKVLNNIKKVYNIQKQVLYATELEKEKLNEDSKKKVMPVNEMLKSSLYN